MNLLYLTDYPTRTTKAPLDMLMIRKFQLLCLITEAEIVFSPFQRYFHLFKEAKNKMLHFATYLKDIGPASGVDISISSQGAKNKMLRFATYLKDIGPASGAGYCEPPRLTVPRNSFSSFFAAIGGE